MMVMVQEGGRLLVLLKSAAIYENMSKQHEKYNVTVTAHDLLFPAYDWLMTPEL